MKQIRPLFLATLGLFMAHLLQAAPSISISAPNNNAVFQLNERITINTTVSDPASPISKVEFFQDAQRIGEISDAPYSFVIDFLAPGTYVFTARAVNQANQSTISAPITIIVNAPPQVSLTSPANNAVYQGSANIVLQSQALDTDGSITKVEFLQNGLKIGEDGQAPFNLPVSGLSPGLYFFAARAIDNRNASSSSTPVAIVVNALPVVSVSGVVNASVHAIGAEMGFTATASDPDGEISKVEFIINGTKVGEDLSSPYTYDHQAFEFGTFNLVARATDNAGGAINSSPLNFIVNAPPIISFSSPSNNTKAQPGETLNLSVNASDPDGNVAKVEFFQNGEKFGEVLGSPFSLKTPALKSGPYIFAARATDNRGFTTNATPVSLVVNALPLGLITNPSKDTSIKANTALSIRINASDADGEVEKVELLLNGEKVGEDAQAPYLIQLNNLPVGVQNLSVRVWDDLGDQQVSAIRKVTVLQSTPVNELQLKRIKAFPNPCAEVLFLEGWKAGERLKVFNLAGMLITEYLAAPQIDLGNLRAGSYLVRGKDGAAFALIRR
jgi:hypothetical protein